MPRSAATDGRRSPSGDQRRRGVDADVEHPADDSELHGCPREVVEGGGRRTAPHDEHRSPGVLRQQSGEEEAQHDHRPADVVAERRPDQD